MKKYLMAAMFATTLTFAIPATAQDSAYTPGAYSDVQGVYIEDGQYENYMDYIAGRYRQSQDFARARGWITGYRILANVNRREGEPDLYLVTDYAAQATQAEQMERERLVNQHMRETTHESDTGSGQRVTMRRLGGNTLLQELVLRPAR